MRLVEAQKTRALIPPPKHIAVTETFLMIDEQRHGLDKNPERALASLAPILKLVAMRSDVLGVSLPAPLSPRSIAADAPFGASIALEARNLLIERHARFWTHSQFKQPQLNGRMKRHLEAGSHPAQRAVNAAFLIWQMRVIDTPCSAAT
jgi:hypothetical protein